MRIVIEGDGISIALDVQNLDDKSAKTMIVEFASKMLLADKAEQKSFAVKFIGCGMKKIEVIKQLRAIFDLPLKEAKEMSESTNRIILTTPSLDEAVKVTRWLQAAGASVEMTPQ